MDSALKAEGEVSSPEAQCSRWDALADYHAIRARSAQIATPLSAEDQIIQTMDDVSPTKWHLAHTTWFFETFILLSHLPGYSAYDPAFGYLFNSYYNGVGQMHPRAERGNLSRPSLAEVHAYRAHVDRAMAQLLADETQMDDIAPLVTLGLHHEQQHQELMLTDIKHVFWANPLRPASGIRCDMPQSGRGQDWSSLTEGLYAIGRRCANATFDDFAFDNEGPVHKVWLDSFAVANALVTNGEYLEFIEDGGYGRPELWLSEGWATVQREGWSAPLYWDRQGEEWSHFTHAGLAPLTLDAPVCHVSHYEADAFARWAGKRLPSEAEWEVAANSGHPLRNLYDCVWQWTSSAYAGYPGFEPAAGAVGEYNGKFMNNQTVLRGGSCATQPGHTRSTYRNFFYSPDRWQFTGIRLAETLS